jgi:outer membrane protein OmpA-like peptidoglycan-associated protein
MKKLFGKKNGEEHNFWMSYTDLMSGFLIIFIIASLLAYKGFMDTIGGKSPDEVKEILTRSESIEDTLGILKVQLDECRDRSESIEDTLGILKVQLDEYLQIKAIREAMSELKSDYYYYNVEFQRFEWKKDILFESESSDIPPKDISELKAAGDDIVDLLDMLNQKINKDNVAFKIIIEGRAAQSHETRSNKTRYKLESKSVKVLSYKRALSLYELWSKRGIIKKLNEHENVEIFISGSGLEGKGRYTGYGESGEDKNKRFIIQIVPYLKFKNTEL